jgi:DUF4097 and DUF4098 domain-containing protein YvlB
MISTAHRGAHIVAVALPLLLVSVRADAGHQLQRQEKKTVEVRGQKAIVITNARGKTIVVGEPGVKRVTIVADKFVNERSLEAAERVMESIHFKVETSDDKISVTAQLPEEDKKHRSIWSMVKGGEVTRIDFTIGVPHEFDVYTYTTSGDVHISNVAGVARVNATSGDVLLRDIGGPSAIDLTSGGIEAMQIGGDLRIAASSGDAQIERVKGLLKVETTSGNVRAREVGGDADVELITGDLDLQGCLGNVVFSTSSGSGRIVGVRGGVKATSSSGDLDVAIVPVGDKDFYLSTSSGNVVLRFLPERDYGFLLNVNTCTGSIRGDMELTKLEQVSRRKLKGIVGNGKSRVMIETASGNVSIIERADEAKKTTKDDKR